MEILQHEVEWLSGKGAEMLKEIGVKAGDRVLDFGCGHGRYTIPLAQVVGESGKVYAVEQNSAPLETLHERLLTFENPGDIQIVNRPDLLKSNEIDEKTVDFILAFDVLQYVEDWDSLFLYFSDLLISSGAVCIYPAVIPHPGEVDTAIMAEKMRSAGFNHHSKSTFRMMHNKFMVDDTVYIFTRK